MSLEEPHFRDKVIAWLNGPVYRRPLKDGETLVRGRIDMKGYLLLVLFGLVLTKLITSYGMPAFFAWTTSRLCVPGWHGWSQGLLSILFLLYALYATLAGVAFILFFSGCRVIRQQRTVLSTATPWFDKISVEGKAAVRAGWVHIAVAVLFLAIVLLAIVFPFRLVTPLFLKHPEELGEQCQQIHQTFFEFRSLSA